MKLTLHNSSAQLFLSLQKILVTRGVPQWFGDPRKVVIPRPLWAIVSLVRALVVLNIKSFFILVGIRYATVHYFVRIKPNIKNISGVWGGIRCDRGRSAIPAQNGKTIIIIRFYFIHFSRLNSISIILFWENTGSASENYEVLEISNHSCYSSM